MKSIFEPVQPIFIIGVHRSGTTLMRFMLSSHPNIYIPPESDFIPRFFLTNPSRELNLQDISHILNIIFTKYRFIEEWRGDPPNPAFFIQNMENRTPAAFLNLLYKLYAEQNGAIRWGDKTPIYTSYIPLLHTLFPNAKFLHMIRDPRDSALSMVDRYRGREFHVDIYFAAKNWYERTRKAHVDGSLLGQCHYLEIFYEELVKRPEAILGNICEFIQEDFQPQMLTHHLLAQKVIPENSHFFDNVRNPITDSSVGRWKKMLEPSEIRIVQDIAGPLMIDLGYPMLEINELNSYERIKLIYLKSKYAVLQSGRNILKFLKLKPPI